MKLELFSLDVFINEVVERKLRIIYFYFEEFDSSIIFTSQDNNMLISYIFRDLTMNFNKEEEIIKLQRDLGLTFRKGILS